MRRLIYFLLLPAFLICSAPVSAHDITDQYVQDIGVSAEIKIAPEKLVVDYWAHIGDIEALRYRNLIDKNNDGEISAQEKEFILNTLKEYLQTQGLAVTINGHQYHIEPGKIRWLTVMMDLKNETKVLPVPVKMDFEFELPFKKNSSGNHSLSFYLANILHRTVLLKIFVANEKGVGLTYASQEEIDVKLMRQGRQTEPGDYQGVSLSYFVSSEAGESGSDETGFIVPEDPTKQKLLKYLRSEELALGIILMALILSFLWGAGHALQPGHGKTLVAAYLVGTRGTAWNAVWLGIIVTGSHIFSVVIIGLVFLMAAEYVQAERLSFYLQIGSGGLIILIGSWMFMRRWQSIHAHSHAHEHGHDHLPDEKVKFKDIVLLGVSGGLVPCPTAIVILLMAISIKRIIWGLALIISFSLGLAAVLIVIGLLMVYAKSFLDRFSKGGRFFRILSVASAAIIVLIGIGIILEATGIIRF